MRIAILSTPIGALRAHADARGLVGLDFLGTKKGKRKPSETDFDPILLDRIQKALDAYFGHGRPLPKVPIGNVGGTPFQQRVWRALAGIPFGETRSYGQVAAAIGSPKAARAVGAACGANPLPLFVPCHRVLGAGGALGGFSGGLLIKKKLLRTEGVSV